MTELEFITLIVPRWYTVKIKRKQNGSKEIHYCSTGTNKGMTETQWQQFKHDCQKRYGRSIQEFYHNVNHLHQDFIVYLDLGQTPASPLNPQQMNNTQPRWGYKGTETNLNGLVLWLHDNFELKGTAEARWNNCCQAIVKYGIANISGYVKRGHLQSSANYVAQTINRKNMFNHFAKWIREEKIYPNL